MLAMPGEYTKHIRETDTNGANNTLKRTSSLARELITTVFSAQQTQPALKRVL